MAKFDYDDRVRVVSGASVEIRPGAIGWIVGVFEERPVGSYFDKFPPGVVYSVEYEDGVAQEIHEHDLEPLDPKET